MEMEALDDVFKYHRFKPTDEEAVTYYLPLLIAGSAHGAEKLIHHAEVYSCEPKDLAAAYAPAPQAVSSGDRWFFSTCKRKNGSKTRSERVAGTGSWTGGGKTRSVHQAGVKVGEVKKLSFKKDNVCTGWIMEEYRWLRPEAAVVDGEKVLCKIHLSPTAPPQARQESAAYRRRQEAAAEPPPPEPDTVTVSMNGNAHAQKRPAPVAVADLSSSSKKMRMAAAVPAIEEEYQDCPDWSVPAAPVPPPAAGSAAAEAEEDTEKFSCSWEELFGEPAAENNTDELMPSSAEPVSGWEAEYSEEVERLLAGGEEELQDKDAEEFMAAYKNQFDTFYANNPMLKDLLAACM
ncbi:unnamed protein product [Alopecurus aequalis]